MIYLNLLIVFLLIVSIHELGHYFSARLFKVQVTDFSVGFGKTLIKFVDKNNTTWKICIIPLGGYVKIKGLENIFQNFENKIEIGTFQSLTLIKKIFILLAGSLFNIISAWVCLFSIMFFFGIATFSNIVGKVLDNTSASINDIRVGDVISNIDSNIISEFSDIPNAIANKKFLNIEIIRDNLIITKNIELTFNSEMNKYILGISSTQNPIIKKFLFFKSLENSLIFIPQYYNATFNYLKKSFEKNTISKDLSGPIGIIKIADQLMLDKIKGVLFLFVIISLFVSIFNLLPIPLLDGGHIVYFIIRSVFSNALPNIFTKIYLAIGLAVMSFLFFIVTFNDIFYK